MTNYFEKKEKNIRRSGIAGRCNKKKQIENANRDMFEICFLN